MRLLLVAALCALPVSASAQIAQRQIHLILPSGQGGLPIHFGDGWEFQTIHLYPDGPRPVLETTNKQTNLTASYILFANDTRNPTAESCRSAVMAPLLRNAKKQGTVKESQQSSITTADGRTLLTASYMVEKSGALFLRQQNVFAFLGDRQHCAEMHLSKVLYQPQDDALFTAELDHFRLDTAFQPDALDYFSIGSLLMREHAQQDAETYYERALAAIEAAPRSADLTVSRVVTDQVSMAYGMAGNISRSRQINQAAIARDPDYPLFYYNLACDDAEQGNAAAARTHLQQAFDRRSHVLKGESMPDPAKDSSLLKLKGNPSFWSFVQSLPRS